MPVRELTEAEEVLPVPEDPPTPRTVSPLPDGEEVLPDLNPVEQFGRGANVGIAETLGAPVDLANAALGLLGLDSDEPFLGSKFIRGGFATLGIAPPPGQDDPDSLFGSVGRTTGAAATMLLGVGPAGGASTSVQVGTRAAPTGTTGRIVQDIGRTAVEAPGRFIASETAAAVGAGAGGFIARERFPDSEAAGFIGEILGGLTPGLVTQTAKLVPTVTGIRLARALVRPFTTTGGQRRAERRVQEATRDAERAGGEISTPDEVPQAGLTPAQRTGDEGLLSLERAVIESSEQLKGQSDEQIARATNAIRRSIAELGDDVSPEKTAEALQEARDHLTSLLDIRVRIAAQRAEERISALGPGATREEANIIARQELETALRSARQQERDLWTAVPDDVALSTENARNAYASLVGSTPRAQRDDVPDIARRFLDPESNEKFTDAESVAELQGLRSKLLEEARNARASGKLNEARLADELADAVLTDLGAQRDAIQGDAGEALRTALDFSAQLNQKFTQSGPVARALGTGRRGGPRVPEELTLETTVGKGGPRARVETRALLEAVEGTQQTPALRGAISDFLLDDFQRRAVRDGRINSRAANNFMARHQDVLEEFPELRSQIQSAIDTDFAEILVAQRAEGLAARLNDPKISRGAVFLKEPVDQAVDRVAKSSNPGETMKEIVRQARRDPTGDAVKGVKTAFGDFLLSQASTRRTTTEGEFILSGRAMKRLLKEGPAADMADALLTTAERKRLNQLADAAEKIEKAVSAAPSREGIIADTPSVFSSALARIVGAQIGRDIAARTGGGTVQTPGVVSNAFQRAVAARVQDPARRLLTDAMKDEDLFKALLRNTGTPAGEKLVRRRLNAWLVAIGAEQLSDDE